MFSGFSHCNGIAVINMSVGCFILTVRNYLLLLCIKKKGKGHPCKALRHCTDRTAPGGIGVELCSFLTTALEGGEGSALRPGRSLPGIHCTGGCVGPMAGLERCGKSRPPTGIRSSDRPACSQSLYRLSYPGPLTYIRCVYNRTLRVVCRSIFVCLSVQM
jgi:hypothetical protein